MSIKISELPSATSVGAGDYIPIVQGGVTKKATSGMIGGEYTQLEYIESTGTQYIDTNYTPQQYDEIEIKNLTCNTTSNFQTILGAGNETNALILTIARSVDQPTQSYYKYFATGSATQISTILSSNTNLKINSNGQLLFNDTVVGSSTYNGSIGNLYIFKGFSSTKPYYASAKFSEFKITNNGNIIRDFIPVIKNTTGEAGLLDKVNGVFYGNSGTGKFLYPQYTENYSTTEQRIGTWIDGKPLYRKIVIGTPPTTSTAGTIATKFIEDIPQDIDFAFCEAAYLNELSATYPMIVPLNVYSPIVSNNVVTQLRRTQYNIVFYHMSGMTTGVTKAIRIYNSDEGVTSSMSAVFHLCYTKSTDTATRGIVEQTRGLTKGGIDEDNMITPIEPPEEEKKEEEPIEKKSEEVVKENNEVSGEELKELGDELVDEQTK